MWLVVCKTSMVQVEESGPADGRGDYTKDGTMDLQGRPVLRSTTGKWKACYFIVGYEIFERMAYYGIASNLVIYLTQNLHQGTVESSNNVTYWIGTVWMTPLIGAYVADTYLGRYWTFIIASAIYLTGMILLTLAVSLPALRPPSCGEQDDCNKKASNIQIGIFYLALYIVALGNGGTKPNVSTMGADQFDDYEPRERFQKLSFFNWWAFSILVGTLFSNTFLIYIQDKVGWAVGYGLPTAGLAVSIAVFVIGTRYYRHKPISVSPLTQMARVIVASVRKWRVVLPDDPKELYEVSLDDCSSFGTFKLEHSSALRCLDRAAIATGPTSLWTLCTVTQVEQTKQMVKMVPILAATFIPSTMVAQTHTFFIKQGATLDRSIGPHFHIPPACLSAFITMSMMFTVVIYDRWLVPTARRFTGNPRGITLLQRMGIGLVIHVIIMATACLAERHRLSVAKAHGISKRDQMVPLSIFVLLPQFGLMGVADNFLEIGKLEFFYDQAPEGMKSLGTAYYTTGLGVGYFLSSFMVSVVADITKRRGGGWILNNLNVSRLDYYYAFCALLSFLNLVFFWVVAKFFVYNNEVGGQEAELGEAEENGKQVH